MSLFVTLGRSQLSTNNVLLSRALAPQCLSTKIQECQGGGRCGIRTYIGNNVVCSDRATCVYRGGVSVEEEGSTKQEVEKEVPVRFYSNLLPSPQQCFILAEPSALTNTSHTDIPNTFCLQLDHPLFNPDSWPF